MYRSLRKPQPNSLTVRINGQPQQVAEGQTVWAVMAELSAQPVTRHSYTQGQPRSGYCAMGACFECCVTIDGLDHQRACQRIVAQGMEITSMHLVDSDAPDSAATSNSKVSE